jgi:hyperosmotically inducible protein
MLSTGMRCAYSLYRTNEHAMYRLLLSTALLAALAAACDPRDDEVLAQRRTEVRAAQLGAPSEPRPSAESTPSAKPPASTLPTADSISDFTITARTRAAILTDPAMGGADVSVNTDNGVVSLAGNVKSAEQTAIASAHAQRQDGVLRVDNHLVYTPR